MAWQGIEAAKQTIEFPVAPSFFSSKKWIKLIPKTTGNRKRLCVRLRSGDKHYLRKSADRKAPIRKAFVRSAHLTSTDLCFSICGFSQVVFIPRAQPHAQSLFLFPIVFGINCYMAFFSSCFRRSLHASVVIAGRMYVTISQRSCISKNHNNELKSNHFIIGSAEALPILCVRYNRWERERERERERDGSSETEVTSPLSR